MSGLNPINHCTHRVSPTVLLVLPAATIYDGCGSVIGIQNGYEGEGGGTSTSQYLQSDMQTLSPVPGGSAVPQPFNFDDLPCPPLAIQEQLDPGYRYSPVIALSISDPMQIGNQSAMMECDVQAIMDPPEPVQFGGSLSGPNDGGGGW